VEGVRGGGEAHRERCSAEDDEHFADLAEEEDAVRGRRVERHALALIRHKLDEELEEGGGDGRVVRPGLEASQHRREVVAVQPLEQHPTARGVAVTYHRTGTCTGGMQGDYRVQGPACLQSRSTCVRYPCDAVALQRGRLLLATAARSVSGAL